MNSMDEDQRKDTRKAAKRLIKISKKHPNWNSKEDIKYAKMIRRTLKKNKVDTNQTGTA